jgi:hypothetical protein
MEQGIFILAVVLTLIAVAVVVSAALLRGRRQVWARFARRHGFDYSTDAARIEVRGIIDNRGLRLFTPDESSDVGELGIQEVRMQVGLHGQLPPGIHISRLAGWAGASESLAGLPAISTGDEQFDQQVFVQSEDPDRARRYLTPERRELVLKLVSDSQANDAGLDGASLFIADREMIADQRRIDERLRLLLSLAPGLDA